jgi:3-oxoacyl-[acyl-carrier-protein] synthase II
MMNRRVVVTGLGLVSPLACGVDKSWDALIAGKSGIKKIFSFDTTDMPTKIAGEVPLEGYGAFNVDDFVPHKDQKKLDKFIHYALAAAEEALTDANWKPESQEDQERTGVIIGSGIGGLGTIQENANILKERGPRRISPFFIPSSLVNLAPGNVSIKYGLQGPNHSVVTACSTGAHSIGDAARLIQFGDADVMVAGGAEGAICSLGIAGFNAARALSTNFNETPEKASRPWDRDRDGFVMGEGAGILILEEYEHAKKRGAKIYCELVGYGTTGDAYHITAPHPEGRGGFRSMGMALKHSKLNIEDIGYVNAHGTSTPLGDEIELGAVERFFGDNAKNLAMSSTKSSIGHLLGAAGGVEAIFSILALKNQIVPPTLNLDNCSVDTVVNLVPHKAQERKLKAVLSNSFGFGGTNATLIFKAV